MSLSCSCDADYDVEWFYIPPSDYSVLTSRRRKRCSSCHNLIDIGATIASFSCYRPPRTFVEENIYGEGGEIDMADKILCETCADIYFSLYELGFECIAPVDNMRQLLKEYQEIYGRNKNE